MSEMRLNENQKKAVEYDGGPLLIIAGAGTGKTTVITKRIEWLITQKGLKPEQILALTFTEKAAQEMEERVDQILPFGYTQTWIMTFHGFCERVVRSEGVHIGLDPGFNILSAAETQLFIRDHLFEFDLNYFRPQGNPTKFIGGLLTHFSRLKDDAVTPDEYIAWVEGLEREVKSNEVISNKVKGKGEIRNPKSLLIGGHAEIQNPKLTDYESRVTNYEPEDIEKFKELANAYQTYERLKVKHSVMDFSDLISQTVEIFTKRPNVLLEYQKKFKAILVDEFQDTNYAQNHLAILLAGKNAQISVVADDDQCLPPETKIITPRGSIQIDKIKKGEMVLSAAGKGHTTFSKVLKVFKKTKTTRFVTIRTKSGYKVTATHNHKMFCYVPKKTYGSQLTYKYVYLMHRKGLGWRLGTTNDLSVRLRLERTADRIIGIAAFTSFKEALFYEALWSLKYAIPTGVFSARQNTVITGTYLDRLYCELDTETSVKRLAKDLGIDLSSHHASSGAIIRGENKRIKLYLTMCARRYKSKWNQGFLQNPLVSHQLKMETSNIPVINALTQAGYRLVEGEKTWVYRKQSSDLLALGNDLKRIEDLTGAVIDYRFEAASPHIVGAYSLVMPSSNLLPGHYVPVVTDKKKVVYDQIVDVTSTVSKSDVYDLEVERTHNFVADGVVVHNSIYRWRGAAVYNVLDFKKHFDNAKFITLIENYRSSQKILDASYALIQHNNPDRLEPQAKIDKKLVSRIPPHRRAGQNPTSSAGTQESTINVIWEETVEDEAELVVHEIEQLILEKTKGASPNESVGFNDIAILVRANNHAEPFTRALSRHAIPYQFLGPGKLFKQEEVKDLVAYCRFLTNPSDDVSLYRVLSSPSINIPGKDIQWLVSAAKKVNLPLFKILDTLKSSDNSDHTILRFVEMVYRHMELMKHHSPGEVLYYYLKDTGELDRMRDIESEWQQKRVENMSAFFNRIKAFEVQHPESSLVDFTKYIDFLMQAGESPLASQIDWSQTNAVKILTVHSAKGLEFDTVFLVNAVDKRFPSINRKDQIPVPEEMIKEPAPTNDPHIAEERRLFYVAVTRAKRNLFITGAKFYHDSETARAKKISPFVQELLGEDITPFLLSKRDSSKPIESIDDFGMRENAYQDNSKTGVQQSDEKTKPIVTYLSYSQIETFETCPLHYKLSYLLKVPTLASGALTFGTTIHDTLRDVYQNKLIHPSEKHNISRALELYDMHWSPIGFDSKDHEMSRSEAGKEILTRFISQDYEKPYELIKLEEPFTFKLTQNLKVGGRIDRMQRLADGTLEIIDYKTGQVPPERELKTGIKGLQLSIYALAATNVFGEDLENVLLSFYYLESGQKISMQRTAEDLIKAKEKIISVKEAIENSNFVCSNSYICQQGCEYDLFCG